MGMRKGPPVSVSLLVVVLLCAAAVGLVAMLFVFGVATEHKHKETEKICNAGWECQGSKYCCNDTISKFFQPYQFENLFSKRNAPTAHAVGFWDYQSFILASTYFQPLGFCTTGGKQMQMMELCAFFGHVGADTSCNSLNFQIFDCSN